MAILPTFGLFRPRAEKKSASTSRKTAIEALEDRRMFAGDTAAPDILLGGVYFEEAVGNDTQGDILHVSFEGGAAGTTLDRITISGDKSGDGLSIGDVFFDITTDDPGAFDAVPLTLLETDGFTVTGISVVDGGTDIVFDLSGFEAGETLVFSVDADEYQADNPETGELFPNALVEGAEFQFSKLTGEFSAVGFVDLTLSGTYHDDFDGRRDSAEAATGVQIELPNDDYENVGSIGGVTINTGGDISATDRTAGAVAFIAQVPLARISGFVYHDKSDDGSFDDGEDPIKNVDLKLIDANGDTIATTQTDDTGYYEFLNLHAGKYTVMEVQPENYYDGKDTPGAPGEGVVLQDDMIRNIMLEYGDHSQENNFGELLGGSIAGRVHAMDGPDCDFDDPDILLEGVTIQLLDTDANVIATTETDEFGRYKFDNLRPGMYGVRELQPSDYFDGGERKGTHGGTVADDLITGIAIGSEQDAVNYDFCEHVGAMISGYVYHDRDNDGNREPDLAEEAIPGVTLLLYRDGVFTGKTQQTNGDGFYKFNDLAPGKYTVREEHPDGWIDGLETPGAPGDGVAPQNDTIVDVMLDFGDHSEDNNFGELLPASIAGRVHASRDGDCDYEDPDILLEGVRIELLDGDGSFLDFTLTNADGEYRFDGLTPGDYQIREIQPENYFDGSERVGTADGDKFDDLITNIRLDSQENATQYDFCEHVGAQISGYVYHDQSDEGIFDPNEDPIANVDIKLLDDAGQIVATTKTNGDGYYHFGGLDAGKYTVMENQPTGWFDGKDTAGAPGDGVALQDDMIRQIMLDYGDHSQENNFGELLGASIAGRVHASNGPDCDFGDPDILLEGVTIELLNADGNVIATTETLTDGTYKFTGLRPGEYQVREIQPSDYFDGGERVGTAEGVLSDDLVTGIVLGSDEHATQYDFCEHVGAMLSGYVYHDRSNEGSFDDGEDPISGVTLKLLKDGVDTGSRAVTDGDGFYKFNDLAPGKYTVMEVQPDGWLDGIDTPGAPGDGVAAQNDMIAQIMLDFGDHSEDNNFGELLPGSIAGLVHVSTMPNCERGPDDPAIEGVTIELLNEAGEVIDTTTTDADGRYKFEGLAPARYSVREIQPAGYFNGGNRKGDGAGTGRGLTKDVFVDIGVGSDEHWTDYDFCEMPPAQLSGYVYIDGAPIFSPTPLTTEQIYAEKNGLRTSDDTMLEGVRVELRNGISGDPIFGQQALPGVYPDGPITTVTGPNGYYEFVGLPAGVYAVVEIQPEEYVDSIDTPGSLGGLAVNAPIPFGGQIFQTELTPGEINAVEQFRSRFGDDALMRITLRVGQNSVENNFSEVERTPGFIPPETPQPEPPNPVFGPLNFIPQTPIRPLLPPTELPPEIFGGSSQARGYTWHLSVVNAGNPRIVPHNEAAELLETVTLETQKWNTTDMQRAEWLLIDNDQRMNEVRRLVYGQRNGIPVSGDWDGDGREEIGVYIDGQWLLDLNANGHWDAGDLWAKLGSRDDLPVTGDWDGDGKTDIGIFGPAWPRDPHAVAHDPGLPDVANYPAPPVPHSVLVGRFGDPTKNMPPAIVDATSGHRLLRRTTVGIERADLIDHVFHYGQPGDTPIAGDWNGDGIRNIGVYRDGQWQLDTNGDGRLNDDDRSYAFGQAGDKPAVGDWNGDGIEDLGVFRAGQWLVDTNGNRELDARDQVFALGTAGDHPIVGDWDGDGVDEPGAYSPVKGAYAGEAVSEGEAVAQAPPVKKAG